MQQVPQVEWIYHEGVQQNQYYTIKILLGMKLSSQNMNSTQEFKIHFTLRVTSPTQ